MSISPMNLLTLKSVISLLQLTYRTISYKSLTLVHKIRTIAEPQGSFCRLSPF